MGSSYCSLTRRYTLLATKPDIVLSLNAKPGIWLRLILLEITVIHRRVAVVISLLVLRVSDRSISNLPGIDTGDDLR